MKKLSIISLLVIAVLVTACGIGVSVHGDGDITKETYTVGNYDQIVLHGSMNATLIEGSEGEITVETDQNIHEVLDIRTEDGKLILGTKNSESYSSSNGVLVTIPIQEINNVTVSGSGSVTSEEEINSKSFTTTLSGSGDIRMKVNSATHTSTVSGSGDIRLSGNTEVLRATVSGSGEIDAYELKSNEAVATVSGSGDIMINMNGGKLTSTITGSGDITYTGDVSGAKMRTTGSGEVRRR